MPIKVLIVDDSLLFREGLSRAMSSDPAIQVVGTAADAFEAEQKIKELKPQVMTLDVELPKVNGIDFLKKIMPAYPIPTVVVTSAPTSAFEALNAGAVDFVKKPEVTTQQDIQRFSARLRQAVKIASVAKVKAENTDLPAASKPVASSLEGYKVNPLAAKDKVIALGASTGGTDALQAVVQNLPADTPGIIITQHMPPVFTKMYADRLNRICKMTCKEAADGDRVERGRILVAAGGFHLRLCKDANGYYVSSKEGEKVSGHCPSVDVMFESVAKTAGKNAIGAILTGMGADGAKGLKKMREAGAFTIGQDKESCVVYGMPMVAFNTGAVCRQAPLTEIPKIILEQLL